MNINTWQNFIKTANEFSNKLNGNQIKLDEALRERVEHLEGIASSRLEHSYFGHRLTDRFEFYGGLLFEFGAHTFENSTRDWPSTSKGVEILIEDIHNILTDNGFYGLRDIKISNYGGGITIDVQKDTDGYNCDASGYHGLLEDLEKLDVRHTTASSLITKFLVQEGLLSSPQLLIEKKSSRMRQYGIYRFGCLIEYETTTGEKQRGLDDIVSDIRAIPTVTIVSIVLGNEKVAIKRYVAGLQIKFIPSYPGNLTQPEEAKAFILRMIKRIKNVRSVSRVTLKTDRIE